MQNITVSSGKNYIISGGNGAFCEPVATKDLVEIIDLECGYELAKICEEKMVELDEEERKAELRFNSDLASYEGTVEELTFTIQDGIEMVDELIVELNSKQRINKDNLYDSLEKIRNFLNNNI